VLEPKTQMETEKIGSFNNPNKKRVTINYKGKIKLPTDSLSKDYEKIIPSELKRYNFS
jgi:hypothetical protein